MKCNNCDFNDEKKLIVDNISHIYIDKEKRGVVRCPSCMKNYENNILAIIKKLYGNNTD